MSENVPEMQQSAFLENTLDPPNAPPGEDIEEPILSSSPIDASSQLSQRTHVSNSEDEGDEATEYFEGSSTLDQYIREHPDTLEPEDRGQTANTGAATGGEGHARKSGEASSSKAGVALENPGKGNGKDKAVSTSEEAVTTHKAASTGEVATSGDPGGQIQTSTQTDTSAKKPPTTTTTTSHPSTLSKLTTFVSTILLQALVLASAIALLVITLSLPTTRYGKSFFTHNRESLPFSQEEPLPTAKAILAFPPSLLNGQCGHTPSTALSHGCIFDLISFSWLHPACSSASDEAEFLAVKPWRWFRDADEGRLVDSGFRSKYDSTDRAALQSVPLGDVKKGDFSHLVVSEEYYRWRCLFLWRRLHEGLVLNGPLSSYLGGEEVMRGCAEAVLGMGKEAGGRGRGVESLRKLVVKYPSCGREVYEVGVVGEAKRGGFWEGGGDDV